MKNVKHSRMLTREKKEKKEHESVGSDMKTIKCDTDSGQGHDDEEDENENKGKKRTIVIK